MDVKDGRPCPGGTGEAPPPPAAAAAVGLDALLDALPLAAVVERRPVVRLAPGRGPAAAAAAERFVVSRNRLAAELGPAAGGDEDLLRHAADRVAARLLPGSVLRSVSARAPVLLPLPLRPPPARAPRPGLIGVLPLAAAGAAARGAPSLAERRAGLAALGWRLGIGGLDAAALRFVDLAALGAAADLLLLRWSPALARQGGAPLRGADPQALVLTGCGGADAVAWGRNAGLVLFGGPAAEAALPVAEAAA